MARKTGGVVVLQSLMKRGRAVGIWIASGAAK